jgi:nucleoside-diphosphate-sugar epimerase
MSHKKILITGGTGFVGANLARYFVEENSVSLIVRPGSDDWRIRDIKENLNIYEVDIGETGVVACIKPDWIFHTAVYGGYSWQRNAQKIIDTNLMGTINFLNSCIDVGFESFINTGSSSEYGFKSHPTVETDFLEPNSNYAFSKASATLYCQFKAQELDLPISTLRLYSVYGHYEDTRRLIPQIILKGIAGGYPNLVSPTIARDFVYIDDVIAAYNIVASGGYRGVFNVGSGKQTTIHDVTVLARDLFGIKEPPKFETLLERNWDTSVWVSDNKSLQNHGWKSVSFDGGFKKTVEWFSQRGFKNS